MYKIYVDLAIISYLAILILIGWRCSRMTKSSGDFYLANRKLGPYVTAMSA